jgi:hypothetical protein
MAEGLPKSVEQLVGELTRDLSKVQSACERELVEVHNLYCGDFVSTIEDVD